MRKTPSFRVEYIPYPTQSVQVLHTDIMFVHKDSYLISVATPLDLTMVKHLGRGAGARTKASLLKAIKGQIFLLRSQNFECSVILSDKEAGLKSLASELNAMGIRLNPAGSGRHVPVIEKKIRQVKERIRAHVNILPFKLSSILLMWLVFFCVSTINMIPTRIGEESISPREKFIGRKLDYKRDLRIGFGDYVQLHPRCTDNTMTSRTEGGIALMSTGNLQGSVLFFSLKSKRIVTRDSWTALPMPSEVIEYLNNLAKDDDIGETEITITRNGQAVRDEAERVPEIPKPPLVVRPTESWQGLDIGDDASKRVEQTTPPILEGARDQINMVKEIDIQREYGFHLSVKQALRRMREPAMKAIVKELTALDHKGTFIPVSTNQVPRNTKIIPSFMFLKEKYLPSGEFEKLKARLVAGGNLQERELYSDISSPTISTNSVFILAALAAKERRYIATCDIGNAYLNADISDIPVYMRMDSNLAEILAMINPIYQEFMTKDNTLIVKLRKALYGCIESAKLWYNNISETIKNIGFNTNPYDACVFNMSKDGVQCTIGIHVDDIIITCSSIEVMDEVINKLKSAYKDVKVHKGKVHSYLGLTFDFSDTDKVCISSSGIISEILQEYQVTGVAVTPGNSNLFTVCEESILLDKDRQVQFHSRVAKLLYLCKRVRPDLLTAVSFLSTRVQHPTEQDWHKLDRVLKYLNQSKDICLTLRCNEPIEIFGYVDASYGTHSDGKGHSGMILSMGEGAFCSRSCKQKLVSRSSTEAELIALHDMVADVISSRNFLIAQGYNIGPAKIYQDNASTLILAERGRSTNRATKHINMRYFFIKDRLLNGDIVLEYKPTKMMVADIFTKPLQGEQFRQLRKILMGMTGE